MPSEAKDDHGAFTPAGQEVQEGEHSVVGPVDVFHDEHERFQPGDRTKVTPPGLEELLARAVSWLRDGEYGLRYEDGILVTEDGIEELTSYRREIIIL